MRKLCLFMVAAALPLGTPLHAQSVRGTVMEAGSERTVEGAAVILMDERGRRVAASLSDPDGRFLVRAPAPGAYRLSAQRVGFASASSPPLTLRDGEVVEQTIVLPTQAITLEGITVVGRRRCTVLPQAGQAAARVWEEARKALDATALAQRQRLVHFDLARHRRELTLPSLQVAREETERWSGYADRPFRSHPARELVEHGFVQETDSGTVYYAPDAEVLLSDEFLDTHCMRVVDGSGDRADLIGLAFEPVRGRRVPDIRGTLWLERGSAELRDLEYRYTRLPPTAAHDRLGGRIEFRRLESGLWIVDRWSIRMPVVHQVRTAAGRAGGVETQARSETWVAALWEEAGEVTAVRRAGAAGEQRRRARLNGLVRDEREQPLPGATVFLSGTQHTATTDSAGRFEMDGLPDGRYSASFHHPALGALGAHVRPQPVVLQAGRTERVELRLPPASEVIAAACPATGERRTEQLLTGSVRAPDGSAPVAGARVIVSWSRFGRSGPAGLREERMEIETAADENGDFVACGAPADVPLQIAASVERRRGPALETRLAPGTWARHTLQAPVPSAPAARQAEEAPAGEVVALEGVVVEARARPNSAYLGGFHQRRESERGHFLDHAQIQARNPSRLVDVLRGIPGVRVTATPTGLGSTVQMERAAAKLQGPVGACPITVYLDGVHHTLGERGLDEIRPGDIAALEVYPGSSQIPARFMGPSARCGVLVLWTHSHRG